MKIVVIGGSGRVGGNVVRRLASQGHDAVAASPSTGVDTITGEGLPDVLTGVDAVVDVSNAPVWDDDAVREFFTTSTRNLLAAERDAGVGHHVAVSIVGCDRLPDSGYLRAKVAQEAEIRAGEVPYTILRATRHPDARSARRSSSAVLPIPASPRRTSTALCPDRTVSSSRSSASHSLRRPRSSRARSRSAMAEAEPRRLGARLGMATDARGRPVGDRR